MGVQPATRVPRGEAHLLLAVLLALAAGGWLLLIWQARSAGDDAMTLTMGMKAPLFLATWVVMMAAMMLPAAAPMVLTYARVQASKRERGQSSVPTWVFVGAYLLLWTAVGALLYAGAVGADALLSRSMAGMEDLPRFGGGLIALAGAYQLSPVKRLCLRKCRSPLDFVLHHWRDGYAGSFRMGFRHATYCVGCCWLLFVVLFPLGIMNIAAMAVLTLLITVEKVTTVTRQTENAVAGALIVYGLLVVAIPALLPTVL